jgi:hypothetical protein
MATHVSSQQKIPSSCLDPVAPLPETRRASPHLAAIHDSFPPDSSLTRTVPRSEWSATDLTGRFPIPSHLGSLTILVILTVFLSSLALLPLRLGCSSPAQFFASLSHPLRYLQRDLR